MFLRLLRPLPRPVTGLAAASLRSNIHAPSCARTLATTAEAADTADTSHTAAVTSPTRDTISDPERRQASSHLPYFVGRNNLNNLSVYQKLKHGGNYKLTIVKKGEGNLKALKEDIRNALRLSNDQIAINSVTNHIHIKGHMRNEVMNFLRTMGF